MPVIKVIKSKDISLGKCYGIYYFSSQFFMYEEFSRLPSYICNDGLMWSI